MLNNDDISSEFKYLGKFHAKFFLEEEDFKVFGETLIRTLKEELGDDFSLEAEKAWVVLYEHLSKNMINTR